MASSMVSHCSRMCAPAKDAACACAINGSDPYLPVPTIEARREGAAGDDEESVLHTLNTADEIHYFDPIALTNGRVGKSPAPDDLQIVLAATRRGSMARLSSSSVTVIGCVSSCGSPLTMMNT